MYLIYGESYRLIEEEMEHIIKKEKNIITMDLSGESTLEDVLTEATYVSMFNEKKIIIVKNAFFFTASKEKEFDDSIEKLINYMKNPVKLTTIIFTTYEKIDVRKKITKEFHEKYKIIAIGNLNHNDLMTKTRDLVFKNKYKINNDAIEYIMESCLNNYDLIYNEIKKIFLYYQEPTTIELKTVKQIISKSIIDNNFKFIEAVINKNSRKILSLLDDLYKLNVEPIVLVNLLAREYRLMYSVQKLSSFGYRRKDINKILALQDWQVEKLAKNYTQYYEEDLRNFIKELADVNYKIVSGKEDPFIALKTFLLNVF